MKGLAGRGSPLAALALASVAFISTAQTLRIMSPANGTLVNPGQRLTIEVTATGGPFAHILLAGDLPTGGIQDLTSPPYRFAFEIPKDVTPRRYAVWAWGFLDSGAEVHSNLVNIDVEPADAPVHLNVDPTPLYKHVGDIGYLITTATYRDGRFLDVMESTLVSYSSDNAAVARVDNVGRVYAVGAGSANIKVSYGRLHVIVPVTVPPLLKVLCGQEAVYVSKTAFFYVQFNMTPDPSDATVTWSLKPPLGHINAEGLYTAPSYVSKPQKVWVIATSVANPKLSGSLAIWVWPVGWQRPRWP